MYSYPPPPPPPPQKTPRIYTVLKNDPGGHKKTRKIADPRKILIPVSGTYKAVTINHPVTGADQITAPQSIES